MFVRDYMTLNPVTVTPETTFPQALNVIRKEKIRHLPVMENGQLVGIVVEKDLLSNQPSPATTLSVYEIYALIETLHVRQMMKSPVITVEGNCPIEEAARIMVENQISCLPIMDGNALLGIITETDIFKVLVSVLGGQQRGNRLTLRLPDRIGELAAVSARIADAGGNIFAVTTARGRASHLAEVTIKETGADREMLMKWLTESGIEVVDVRASEKYPPRLFG